MVGKRIQGGRSTAGRIAYATDTESPADVPERDQNDPLNGLGEKIVAVGSLNGLTDDWRETRQEILDLDHAYAGKAKGKTTEHFMLSWREGEDSDKYPTYEKMQAAVQEVLDKTGFGDRPAIWTCHNDTAHRHVHIIVSKIEPTETGRLRIRDGHAWVIDPKKKNHSNIVESVHVALAVLCRDHGWEPEEHCRYGADLKRIYYPETPVDKDGIKLRPRQLDQEAHSGQACPARVMGEKARDILRQAKTWPEATTKLAEEGITLKVKEIDGKRTGAILKAAGVNLKLSALPADCGLAALDKRFGAGQAPAQAPAASVNGQVRILVEAARRRPAKITAAQVKHRARRFAVDSTSWPEFLGGLEKEGWKLLRAGRSGAVISVPAELSKTGQECRLKLSDIPGRYSYSKLSEKFGGTLEDLLKNNDTAVRDFEPLFRDIVVYPKTATNQNGQNPLQPTTAQTGQNPVRDETQINLPSYIADNEKLLGVPSPERKLAELSVYIIRDSLQNDKTIDKLLHRFAENGIQVNAIRTKDGQTHNLRLSVPGASSITLTSLPRDCRLQNIGKVFGQRFKRTGSRPVGNNNGPDVLTFAPDEDIFEIYRKTMEHIIQEWESAQVGVLQRRYDNQKYKAVNPEQADILSIESVKLVMPEGLTASEQAEFIRNERIRRIFDQTIKSNHVDGNGLTVVLAGLEKLGLKIEQSRDSKTPHLTDGIQEISLKSLELSWKYLVKQLGEPPILAKTEEEQEPQEEAPATKTPAETIRETIRNILRVAVQVERDHVLAHGGQPDGWPDVMTVLERRGFKLELNDKGAPIVTDGKTTLDFRTLGIDFNKICLELGSPGRLHVHGWNVMTEDQRKEVRQNITLRDAFSEHKWENVLSKLDRAGARIELTGDGKGGRLVLRDGKRVKISEITGQGLAQHRAAKQGDLDNILKVRKAQDRQTKARQAQNQAQQQEQQKQQEKQKQEEQKQSKFERQGEEFRTLLRSIDPQHFGHKEHKEVETYEKITHERHAIEAQEEALEAERLQQETIEMEEAHHECHQ